MLAPITQESARGITFMPASQSDEPDVRRLLREIEIGGDYRITLRREPDAFASSFGLARAHAFVLARNAISGEAVGLCERVVYECFVNGERRLLPYLGALRIAHAHRNRISMLRGGFAALRELPSLAGELPFALTSIAADNTAAIRLLTSGLSGLPRYDWVGDLSTLFLRPRRARRTAAYVTPLKPGEYPMLAAFLQGIHARYQFAPVWTTEALKTLQDLGLPTSSILVARRSGRISGALAVWDQRPVRQAVVHGYPAVVSRFRPLLNLVAPLVGAPAFPVPGRPINMAALSHLAAEEGDIETVHALLDAALGLSWRRGFDVAMIGLGTQTPWCKSIVERYRAVAYTTKLFVVYWPDEGCPLALDGRYLVHPEAALL